MNCLKRSPYCVGFTDEMVFFLWNRDLKMVSMPFFVSYCCRMSMMPAVSHGCHARQAREQGWG